MAKLPSLRNSVDACGAITTQEVSFHIVDHRPINEADITPIGAGFEESPIDDATKSPKTGEQSWLFEVRIEVVVHSLHGPRIETFPTQESTGPGRRQFREIIAPIVVTSGC